MAALQCLQEGKNDRVVCDSEALIQAVKVCKKHLRSLIKLKKHVEAQAFVRQHLLKLASLSGEHIDILQPIIKSYHCASWELFSESGTCTLDIYTTSKNGNIALLDVLLSVAVSLPEKLKLHLDVFALEEYYILTSFGEHKVLLRPLQGALQRGINCSDLSTVARARLQVVHALVHGYKDLAPLESAAEALEASAGKSGEELASAAIAHAALGLALYRQQLNAPLTVPSPDFLQTEPANSRAVHHAERALDAWSAMVSCCSRHSSPPVWHMPQLACQLLTEVWQLFHFVGSQERMCQAQKLLLELIASVEKVGTKSLRTVWALMPTSTLEVWALAPGPFIHLAVPHSVDKDALEVLANVRSDVGPECFEETLRELEASSSNTVASLVARTHAHLHAAVAYEARAHMPEAITHAEHALNLASQAQLGLNQPPAEKPPEGKEETTAEDGESEKRGHSPHTLWLVLSTYISSLFMSAHVHDVAENSMDARCLFSECASMCQLVGAAGLQATCRLRLAVISNLQKSVSEARVGLCSSTWVLQGVIASNEMQMGMRVAAALWCSTAIDLLKSAESTANPELVTLIRNEVGKCDSSLFPQMSAIRTGSTAGTNGVQQADRLTVMEATCRFGLEVLDTGTCSHLDAFLKYRVCTCFIILTGQLAECIRQSRGLDSALKVVLESQSQLQKLEDVSPSKLDAQTWRVLHELARLQCSAISNAEMQAAMGSAACVVGLHTSTAKVEKRTKQSKDQTKGTRGKAKPLQEEQEKKHGASQVGSSVGALVEAFLLLHDVPGAARSILEQLMMLAVAAGGPSAASMSLHLSLGVAATLQQRCINISHSQQARKSLDGSTAAEGHVADMFESALQIFRDVAACSGQDVEKLSRLEELAGTWLQAAQQLLCPHTALCALKVQQGSLLVSRVTAGAMPLLLILPLTTPAEVHDDNTGTDVGNSLCGDQAAAGHHASDVLSVCLARLEALLEENSTAATVPAAHGVSEDEFKRQWWKARLALNDQLKDLLSTMSDDLLQSWGILLAPPSTHHLPHNDFIQSLAALCLKTKGSRKAAPSSVRPEVLHSLLLVAYSAGADMSEACVSAFLTALCRILGSQAQHEVLEELKKQWMQSTSSGATAAAEPLAAEDPFVTPMVEGKRAERWGAVDAVRELDFGLQGLTIADPCSTQGLPTTLATTGKQTVQRTAPKTTSRLKAISSQVPDKKDPVPFDVTNPTTTRPSRSRSKVSAAETIPASQHTLAETKHQPSKTSVNFVPLTAAVPVHSPTASPVQCCTPAPSTWRKASVPQTALPSTVYTNVPTTRPGDMSTKQLHAPSTGPTILVLGVGLHPIPWESLPVLACAQVYRLPSLLLGLSIASRREAMSDSSQSLGDEVPGILNSFDARIESQSIIGQGPSTSRHLSAKSDCIPEARSEGLGDPHESKPQSDRGVGPSTSGRSVMNTKHNTSTTCKGCSAVELGALDNGVSATDRGALDKGESATDGGALDKGGSAPDRGADCKEGCAAEWGPAVNLARTLYLLNPGGDLLRTQDAFVDLFASRMRWEGWAGSVPSTRELLTALQEHEAFIYCGHGSSEQYLPAAVMRSMSRCPAALLMGCSSARLRQEVGREPSGALLNFLLSGCPFIIANLWDVTDGDVDRLCKGLLDSWLSIGGRKRWESAQDADAPSMLPALAGLQAARQRCRLPCLTGAACVCYGIPSWVSWNGVDPKIAQG